MKTIYYNGTVYTGSLPLQEAFAVCGDTFTFSGTTKDALALREPDDTVVDLNGAFVCAGFNDSHMHLLSYGETLRNAPLHRHTDRLEALLQCLRQHLHVHGTARGGWLIGRGWNQDYFSDVHRMPNRYDLDTVSTEIPVCAVRACGHALAVNSRALELLGVTAETPQPDGGEIGMENGMPNGLFFDNAMDLVYDAIPAPSKSDIKDMIRTACHALNAYGVTSSHSDDYCVFSSVSWQTVCEAYRELESEGALTVRVYEQNNFTTLSDLQEFVEAGNRTGIGSSRFRIGPLKMLGDGALGPRTAFLREPYADDPSTVGLSVFTQEVFDEMIGYANRNGMQTAIHTIGDACLDRVLSALEKATTDCPGTDLRHGIVHCQITRPDQLEKLAAMGLQIYMQSIFLDYDIHIVAERVGTNRAASSYRWKTLLDAGCHVSNGTDCPVELPFALGGMQCAVTRSNLSNNVAAYLPEEGFSVQQALDSYTKAGAYASFEEAEKGAIAPGMLADFIVLGGNPFAVPHSQIKDIPVLATYVGGTCVYASNEPGN